MVVNKRRGYFDKDLSKYRAHSKLLADALESLSAYYREDFEYFGAAWLGQTLVYMELVIHDFSRVDRQLEGEVRSD